MKNKCITFLIGAALASCRGSPTDLPREIIYAGQAYVVENTEDQSTIIYSHEGRTVQITDIPLQGLPALAPPRESGLANVYSIDIEVRSRISFSYIDLKYFGSLCEVINTSPAAKIVSLNLIVGSDPEGTHTIWQIVPQEGGI